MRAKIFQRKWIIELTKPERRRLDAAQDILIPLAELEKGTGPAWYASQYLAKLLDKIDGVDSPSSPETDQLAIPASEMKLPPGIESTTVEAGQVSPEEVAAWQ